MEATQVTKKSTMEIHIFRVVIKIPPLQTKYKQASRACFQGKEFTKWQNMNQLDLHILRASTQPSRALMMTARPISTF